MRDHKGEREWKGGEERESQNKVQLLKFASRWFDLFTVFHRRHETVVVFTCRFECDKVNTRACVCVCVCACAHANLPACLCEMTYALFMQTYSCSFTSNSLGVATMTLTSQKTLLILHPPPLPESVVKTNDNGKGGGKERGRGKTTCEPFPTLNTSCLAVNANRRSTTRQRLSVVHREGKHRRVRLRRVGKGQGG